MTEIDTSKEMIQLSVEALRKIANDQQIHAPESWDDSDCISCAADRLDALLSERDALRKAVDSYSYIGRDALVEQAEDCARTCAEQAEKIQTLTEQLAEARNALKVYACKQNWSNGAEWNGLHAPRIVALEALKTTSAEGEG